MVMHRSYKKQIRSDWNTAKLPEIHTVALVLYLTVGVFNEKSINKNYRNKKEKIQDLFYRLKPVYLELFKSLQHEESIIIFL